MDYFHDLEIDEFNDRRIIDLISEEKIKLKLILNETNDTLNKIINDKNEFKSANEYLTEIKKLLI